MIKTVAILSLLAAFSVHAQDTPLAFEAASVKVAAPSTPLAPGQLRIRGCGGRDPTLLRCNGATLKMLLIRAYDVRAYQVQGPTWIDSDAYDVMARVPEGVPTNKVPAMLQTLLAERFGVKFHKETRLLPSYELSVRKGGPKLKEVDPSKLPALPEPAAGPPPPMPSDLKSMAAGALVTVPGPNGRRTVRGNVTIERLANFLGGSLDRRVVDGTGFKGTYEIELTYTADERESFGGFVMEVGSTPPAATPAGSTDASEPTATLGQAVQALGLKLEAKKTPVEVIVVDQALRVPTQN
jgi:uncharacterized protein (TIGR03435 family)